MKTGASRKNIKKIHDAEKIFGGKKWVPILSMLVGLIVCYIFGTVWFMAVYAAKIGQIGLWTAVLQCVVPFIIPDLLKIAAASAVRNRLIGIIK